MKNMKNVKRMTKNEEAVSPVIGVILMVVITVIIAAILAAFAFGIGAPSKSPTSSLKIVKAVTTDIYMEHQGGDPLAIDNIQYIVVDPAGSRQIIAAAGVVYQELTTPGDNFFSAGEGVVLTPTIPLTAGDRATVIVVDVPSGHEILSTQVNIV